jgi:hypothetical protein
MAYSIEGLAAAALDAGQPALAARSLAASTAVRSRAERPAWAAYYPVIEELAGEIRAALGATAYDVARAEGESWDISEALSSTLTALGRQDTLSIEAAREPAIATEVPPT